jgi:endoglucanase
MAEENKKAEEAQAADEKQKAPKKKHKALKITLITVGCVIGVPALVLLTICSWSWAYSVPAQKATISDPDSAGLVKAEGRALYDKDGKKLHLSGINVGNLLLQEGWMSPLALEPNKDASGNYQRDSDGYYTYPDFTEEQFETGLAANPNMTSAEKAAAVAAYRQAWFSADDFKVVKNNLGLNAIRLPFYWRNILNDDLSVKSETEAFSYLDWFVTNCKDNGLYCILDLHGAPGGQNGYEHSGQEGKNDLWTVEKYQTAAADLWKAVADHYTKTDPELGKTIACYDILNEPCSTINGKTTSACYPVFDKIYKAIRGEGDNHVVTFEGAWDYSTLPNPNAYNWTNIMYEYHFYNWYHEKLSQSLYHIYLDMTNMFRNYEVPVLIGEFNCFEDRKAWANELNRFDSREYNWTIWNYKVVVTGWWSSSWGVYTGKMDPDNNNKDALKANVSKCTLAEFMTAVERVKTANCEAYTTYQMITDHMGVSK